MAKLIGTDPNQVPTNADLGSAAYADTQNMPETRLTNQPLSAKFGAEGDVPTDLASTLDFMQIGSSTFVQTGSDAQAFIKSNHYWNGSSTSYVNNAHGSTTIRINENNSGILQFETAPSGSVGTAARLTIDATGAVTMPHQPAFLAKPASAQLNIGTNSEVTVAFGLEIFDQNADFASNTFTAPVTGKYQFNLSLYTNNLDTAADYYVLAIKTSNRTYQNVTDPLFTSDPVYWSQVLCVLADMDANDTAHVFLQQGAGNVQTDITTECLFSGYLVA